MAGKALHLEGRLRIADYLSLGLLARLVSPSLEQVRGQVLIYCYVMSYLTHVSTFKA